MSSQSSRWIATARLLRRAGFGATGPQIDAVANQDWSIYLDQALGLDPDADPGAVATPRPMPVTPDMPDDNAGDAAFNEFSSTLSDQMTELTSWWVRRMAAVNEPVHEKLTLVWHNHFATSAQKVPAAEWMGHQNQKLRTLKLGDFRTLAYAMLTDAAMLFWLDGVRNSAGAANENLSREFMELFTLGHGNGYTERDVKEGARALTGWFIGPGGKADISPTHHDSTPKTVMGVAGDLDEANFCDIVLGHPKSAQFVATKLWRMLASDTDPSTATLDRLVSAYGQGRDLKALTKAILLDPEFSDRAGTVVNTPIEWLIGVIRSLKAPIDDPDLLDAIVVALTVMGQRPFYPPNVGGWPSGQAWLSTSSISARAWAADKFTKSGDLSVVEQSAQGDRVDAVGYLLGIGAWTDRTAAALKPLVNDPQQLVAAAVNTPEYLTS
ncbi:uncharacterized protein (DUF1800 family) [Mycobacterium sp. OAS707]|uniref:DUF1800 domain-containing protein n=1 Tax=Mycobacterium sp. OAS707 TaxID=2663822 RepID=UPI00178A549A|nr:DUF1800 domain-containing protein [Mycobacterium sp. OAS707]MBE1546932.1 uncharacterized protein (DUF1800 family) [Mycobacterium sp. OAS707]